jgi:hypothetical protein
MKNTIRKLLSPRADRHDAQRRSVVAAAMAGPLAMLIANAAKAAGGIEQFWKYNIKPEEYLAGVFGNDIPAPQVADSSGKDSALLQRLPGRLRYWRKDGRTAWIFDEIGKEGYAPTTCGFVVKSDATIESASVLIYRESRGEQVGLPSFVQQFVGARAAGTGIDKPVDNVSGATYSVKMMQRMARVALALDASVPY